MSSGMRVKGLLRKESLQIVRDPSAIVIALVLPVVLLLLFGYGVSLDAENVPVAVVLESQDDEAVSFASRFSLSRYFLPTPTTSMAEAEEAMRAGEVEGIIRLRSNFGDLVASGRSAPVQLLVNGVDANRARQIIAYVNGVWQRWITLRGLYSRRPAGPPVSVSQRIWFNAEVRSQNFLVPGLIVVIMTLSGSLLTALVMAREWERGTMEALLVTPVRVREILFGKLLPYYVLGMGGMVLSVVMAVFLFGVPLRGSLLVLAGVSTLFLLAALGMGLLISVLAKNQFVAGQSAILATFLPAFFLSGFIFDLNSTPAVVRVVSHLIAARYFADAVKTIFLAGEVWSVILPSSAALVALAAIFLGLSLKKTSKRLE